MNDSTTKINDVKYIFKYFGTDKEYPKNLQPYRIFSRNNRTGWQNENLESILMPFMCWYIEHPFDTVRETYLINIGISIERDVSNQQTYRIMSDFGVDYKNISSFDRYIMNCYCKTNYDRKKTLYKINKSYGDDSESKISAKQLEDVLHKFGLGNIVWYDDPKLYISKNFNKDKREKKDVFGQSDIERLHREADYFSEYAWLKKEEVESVLEKYIDLYGRDNVDEHFWAYKESKGYIYPYEEENQLKYEVWDKVETYIHEEDEEQNNE